MAIPLTLVQNLIMAELRPTGLKTLHCGYEGNIVICNLAGIHESGSYLDLLADYPQYEYHLYRWNGDSIWYKRGLGESPWIQRYTATTEGNYVTCTGLKSSPLVKATFRDQKLSSPCTGPPTSCTPEFALVYKEPVVIVTNPVSLRPSHRVIPPVKTTYPKEYYYLRGHESNSKAISDQVKADCLELRRVRKNTVVFETLKKLLNTDDRWSYNIGGDVLFRRMRVGYESDHGYERDSDHDRYETRDYDEVYEDKPMFTVSSVDDDTGTTITLKGTPESEISSIIIVIKDDKELHVEPVVVWNDNYVEPERIKHPDEDEWDYYPNDDYYQDGYIDDVDDE